MSTNRAFSMDDICGEGRSAALWTAIQRSMRLRGFRPAASPVTTLPDKKKDVSGDRYEKGETLDDDGGCDRRAVFGARLDAAAERGAATAGRTNGWPTGRTRRRLQTAGSG